MVRRIVTRQQRLAAACALGLLAVTTPVRALDPSARKLAERYENLLRSNPLQEAAFDRLWKIYDEQGESSQLTARGSGRTRKHWIKMPFVMVRVALLPPEASCRSVRTTITRRLSATPMGASLSSRNRCGGDQGNTTPSTAREHTSEQKQTLASSGNTLSHFGFHLLVWKTVFPSSGDSYREMPFIVLACDLSGSLYDLQVS